MNLQKLSSTQVSHILNHSYLFQAHISKEKDLVCFIPSDDVNTSGLSQWCEVDRLLWRWDMQKTRGGKWNHEGGWSNYKEKGKWVVSLQSKVSSKYQKSSSSCACHWCGAFSLMNWNVWLLPIWGLFIWRREALLNSKMSNCQILQFLLLLARVMLLPRDKNPLP